MPIPRRFQLVGSIQLVIIWESVFQDEGTREKSKKIQPADKHPSGFYMSLKHVHDIMFS